MERTLENTRRYVLPAVYQVRTGGSWLALTAMLVLTSLGGCVAMGFVPWQQSLSGTGKLVALAPMERQQSIDAPVEGRIVKWHVVEGSSVKKGDPVAEMADLDPALPTRLGLERTAILERIRAIAERERQLDERILELDQSLKNELSAADFRIQQARDRIRAGEQTLEAANAKVTVSTQNVDRHRTMFPKGLVSRRQVEVAKADKETADAELRRAEAQLDEARNVQRTTEMERARALNNGLAIIRDARASRESARGEAASARQSLQPLETRLNRQTTQTILAPVDATIFRLMAQPGSAVVKSGQAIASIVPEVGTPVAEIWVDGNDMPLVSAGRKVRLQFEGWPAIQFVGWPSVAVGTFGGVVRLVDSTDDGKGKFRVLVEPDPSDQRWPDSRYLRQGVRAKGWVLLNTVPMGFEVWRQFNGFPPAVSTPPQADAASKGSK